MIVCSCNVLTDAQVIATLGSECPASPRTPGQAYRCLGCDPCCGRCLPLINQVLRDARGVDAVQVGCDVCPGATAEASDGNTRETDAGDTLSVMAPVAGTQGLAAFSITLGSSPDSWQSDAGRPSPMPAGA